MRRMHSIRRWFQWLMAIPVLSPFLSLQSDGATVTYVQQTADLAATYVDGTAGVFNQGSTEIGMYAKTTGNKEVVAWRNLTVDGTGTGAARSLQVGDVFTVTVSATAAFGGMGFSLNANGTQGTSYANRVSGSRLFVQEVGTEASWEVNSASGTGGYTSLDYGVSSTRRDYSFKVYLTSESTANVLLSVDGVDKRAYNLTLNGTAGANIDAFSLWLKDDWNGSSSADIYWKQNTSVENLGQVELGYFLATGGTFEPGLISDGLAADSTSTTSVNAVLIGGDVGSQVNLTQNNTYTGATTINANAAGEAVHANALGSTAAGTTVSAGGVLKLFSATSTQYAAEPLSLNGTGVNGVNGALQHVGGATTWTGGITLASNSRINADVGGSLTITGAITGGSNVLYLGANGAPLAISGVISGSGGDQSGTTTSVFKDGGNTLTLSGSNTYTGATAINAGTLVAASASALGSGAVTIASGATLQLDNLVANSITNNGGTLSFAGGGIQRTSTQATGTVATLAAGTAGSPTALSPTIAWQARPQDTYSDVLDLTGTNGTVQILQLSYDPALLGGVSESDLQLGWDAAGTWVNAVDGNTGSVGSSAELNGSGSYVSLGILATADYLGSWGRDTAANVVWAVVDHNSDFVVVAVPEPGVGLTAATVMVASALVLRRVSRPRRLPVRP